MCKIFGLTSTASLAMPALREMIGRSHKALTATQRDGYGFAIASNDGGHYVEKWDNPANFPGPGEWPKIRENLGGLPVEADCWTHGAMPEKTGGAFIAHARTATCSRGAINAHPHIRDGWALVHNGVVSPIKGKTKPCDSVHILDSFITHKGGAKLHADVTGYLAVLGFTPQGRIFALRDERAPLVVAWVPSLAAWAFASNAELLAEIVKAPHDKAYTVSPYNLAVFDGKKWANVEVKPWQAAPSAKASKAFGDDDERLFTRGDTFPDYNGKAYAGAWKKSRL